MARSRVKCASDQALRPVPPAAVDNRPDLATIRPKRVKLCGGRCRTIPQGVAESCGWSAAPAGIKASPRANLSARWASFRPPIRAGTGHRPPPCRCVGRQRGATGQPFCSTLRPTSSAICTALSAAPLRRLSLTHQRFRPFSIVLSWRIRLMNVAKSPAASIGVV